MKYKVRSHLRCVSSFYEDASTFSKGGTGVAFGFPFFRKQTGCELAAVLAKPRGGEAVISSLGIFSAK